MSVLTRPRAALALAAILGLTAVPGSGALRFGDARDRGSTQDPPEQVRPEPKTDDEEGEDAPPRIKVAGIRSLWIRSELRFEHPDAALHTLDTAFAFPARARLELRPVGGRASARVLRYRRGKALHAIDLGSESSRRIEGAESKREALQLELRLAAFLFPESHEWGAATQEPGEGHAVRKAEIPGLGTLLARIDEGADVPASIEARLEGGELMEAIDVLARKPGEHGRTWPAELRLRTASGTIWTERVLDVDRRVLWTDDWFTPPDRRTRASQAVDGERAVDLLGEVCRDVVFDPRPTSLQGALEEARKNRAGMLESVRRHGRDLAPGVRLVLDEDLRPKAARWILEEAEDGGGEAPDGWRTLPPRLGRVALLDGIEDVTAGRVRRLKLAFQGASPPDDAPLELLLVSSGDDPGGARLTLSKQID